MSRTLFFVLGCCLLFEPPFPPANGRGESVVPPRMGRDTVLVWHSRMPEEVPDMVVRIADFLPDRYFEWENSTTQGTVLIGRKAIVAGRGFVSSRLFEGGMDTTSKDATALWLSQPIYRQLKSVGKSKVRLDSIDAWMRVEGTDHFGVKVNGTTASLPVLRVKDDRGSERWFLDSEENPLLVRHLIRNYEQFLVSITNDRAGTLRWIKGRKLNPSR